MSRLYEIERELREEGYSMEEPELPEPRTPEPSWPKLEPLDAELPAVLAFNSELLPAAVAPFAQDVAERMQVPIDLPAVALMLCLAGAVSRRARIQPKANDGGWVVVPNLWGGIVAPPGYLKSPVIQTVTRPLLQIQDLWRQEHSAETDAHKRSTEEYELRHAAWKENFKAAAKKGRELPEWRDDAPTPPTLKRLVINDATFEALHQTMSENPSGVFVIRDELTGWWSQLDRAGREGERAFCLQAWNGDTGHTIDRIGRGTIHVEACCMSMLGGIQPARLRSYLVDAIEDGPGNDGLIQRFQLLVWPDTQPKWRYVDRPVDSTAERGVERVFNDLVALDPANPLLLRFSSDAQALFVDWLTGLESKVRFDDMHPALTSHLSKYRSLMPSLAALFHLADAAGNPSITSDVNLECTRRAAAWCDYLESHARRVYACLVSPQFRAACELAEKIKRRQVGSDGFFFLRDVYKKGWTGLDTAAAKQAAEILEHTGWIRRVHKEPGAAGGRPPDRFEVNPEVWKK